MHTYIFFNYYRMEHRRILNCWAFIREEEKKSFFLRFTNDWMKMNSRLFHSDTWHFIYLYSYKTSNIKYELKSRNLPSSQVYCCWKYSINCAHKMNGMVNFSLFGLWIEKRKNEKSTLFTILLNRIYINITYHVVGLRCIYIIVET